MDLKIKHGGTLVAGTIKKNASDTNKVLAGDLIAAYKRMEVLSGPYEKTIVCDGPGARDLRQMQLMLSYALPHLSWRHHGIGVLQAYLYEGSDEEVRVHIWHPDLVVTSAGQVHNHRFCLRSTVLFGELQHNEYHLTEDASGVMEKYEVVHARLGNDEPTKLPGRFKPVVIPGVIKQGQTYVFERGEFHRSGVDAGAVTIVTKLEQRNDIKANILVPVGTPAKHGFSHEQLSPSKISEFVHSAACALLTGKNF